MRLNVNIVFFKIRLSEFCCRYKFGCQRQEAINLSERELSPNVNDYDTIEPIKSFDRNQDNCNNESLRVEVGSKFRLH